MNSTHKNFRQLPTANISTAYQAQPVTGEFKFELADGRLNSFAQKNLVPRPDRIMQLARRRC